MKQLLSLFWSFFKIGSFTFGGGYAMVPLIEKEIIDNHGWIRRDDFLGLLTLAQSAPGAIAVNTAVFVGYKIRGYAGAIAATAGVVLPSFTIILLIAIYFTDVSHLPAVEAAFKGIRPAVVALIATPLVGLSRGMSWTGRGIAIAAAAVVWLLGVSPVWFIMAGAAAGILRAYLPLHGANGSGCAADNAPEDDDTDNAGDGENAD